MDYIYRKPHYKVSTVGGISFDTVRVPPPVKDGGIHLMDIWSIRFDGQHIMQIMLERPRMSVNDIIAVVVNEGGYVDNDMIVHKGSASVGTLVLAD